MGENKKRRKPLLIGCSGGGGHNSAILGIYNHLKSHTLEPIDLPLYNPQSADNRSISSQRDQIARGVDYMHHAYMGTPIQWFLSKATCYPILPKQADIAKEIIKLNKKEPRAYIDMLLDVYPAGYESAAIWNILQSQDKVKELKKLTDLQHASDKDNYQSVYQYFFNKLMQAIEEGEAYTELISSQAMALPALCDVVKDYNKLIELGKIHAPKLYIHQYLTDLPSKGAVHFFNPIARLSKEQQSQMKLYGLGMNKETLASLIPCQDFAAIEDIDPKQNPMVRPGFKEAQWDMHERLDERLELKLEGVEKTDSIIEPNQKIAAIMLGSQGSNDTCKYIEPLLRSGMEKVFVFGANNETIRKEIATLSKNPDFQCKIIGLENQDDKAIASLMTRCNILVTRGGGMTVMELMAMNHPRDQLVFIHHADPPPGQALTSGISWEDANVNALITTLKAQGIYCKKTSLERIHRFLDEGWLINQVKKFQQELNTSREEISTAIQRLSNKNLREFVILLIEDESLFFRKFSDHLRQDKPNELNKSISPFNFFGLQIQELVSDLNASWLRPND